MYWILENKEWVFSGIGVFMITLIFGIIKTYKRTSQVQRSGDHCVNLQSTGNINYTANKKPGDKDVF